MFLEQSLKHSQVFFVYFSIQIPQENINHVQTSQDTSTGLQTMETALVTQQATDVQVNPMGVEVSNGTPITISGGRLVLANGETAPLTTDPASK